jgi:folate-binding protein YgfZ
MEVNAPAAIGLDDLGIVRVRGVDAVRFLQGQLSNDVTRLSAGNSLLAGYHNPQGRAIAVLRLVQWDADDILAIVPRELAGVVATRLAKFVLRAKVKVTDESAGWRVWGIVGVALPTADGGAGDAPGRGAVAVGDAPPRWLVVSPQGVDRLPGYVAGDRLAWQRLEVASGLPQVLASTSEEFVAQMLNLDVLNAIAFDKGCYTGQEVIARAHYRGRVKRRMQRFVSREACQLAPGESGQLADGRTFKVVLAAQLADGRCDFLAVAPMAGAEREATGTVSAAAPALRADQVPLPYSLPD